MEEKLKALEGIKESEWMYLRQIIDEKFKTKDIFNVDENIIQHLKTKKDKKIFKLEHAQIFFQTYAEIVAENHGFNNVEIKAIVKEVSNDRE